MDGAFLSDGHIPLLGWEDTTWRKQRGFHRQAGMDQVSRALQAKWVLMGYRSYLEELCVHHLQNIPIQRVPPCLCCRVLLGPFKINPPSQQSLPLHSCLLLEGDGEDMFLLLGHFRAKPSDIS